MRGQEAADLDESAKLSNYSFTQQDKFAVLVLLPAETQNSLHQPLVDPLAGKLAVMLAQELGVTATPVAPGDYQRWLRQASQADAESVEPRSASALSQQYFRTNGYRGYLLVNASEFVDKAARNDFDYSLRTRFALRVLETNDKGEPIAPALAQFSTAKAVCSRRFRVDKGSPAVNAGFGYRLASVERCAATVEYRARARLQEFK